MGKKIKTAFLCLECGHQSVKWMGQCPSCQSWNTFEEERIEKKSVTSGKPDESYDLAKPLNEVLTTSHQRYHTGIDELDRVLGGGIVPGSLILIGGEPGIGKSTLLTKLLGNIAALDPEKNVLYVSGEESANQLAKRALRLGVERDNLYLLNESSWEKIEREIKRIRPKFFVLDSIQTTTVMELNSPPGTISQIRDVTYHLMNYTKASDISSFVVGHITKDGAIAGPKVLEHMVDTVIYFEGDQSGQYRLLRAQKNRFGNTNEIGIFEMADTGLKEVRNPSQYFLEMASSGNEKAFGRAVTSIVEGTRTLFVEIQALVAQNKFNNSQRTTQGLDPNRLSMLSAVIEKYFGLKLYDHDIYLNVVGGIKLNSRESDLAIITAILSSFQGKAVDYSTVFLGEVGLTGEIRPVPRLELRLKEMEQLNYKRVVLPYKSAEEFKDKFKMEMIGLKKASDLEDFL